MRHINNEMGLFSVINIFGFLSLNTFVLAFYSSQSLQACKKKFETKTELKYVRFLPLAKRISRYKSYGWSLKKIDDIY